MSGVESERIRLAVAGDDDVFAQLVAERWAFLVRLARSVVGEADAEDAVQDAAVVAWRRLGRLKRPEAFDLWLRRVVTRLCLRRARRQSSRYGKLGFSPAATVSETPDAEAAIDVERLLASLPPRQRAVMQLTVVEEMSDGEIGSLLGIRPASVRAHRRRARQSLQRLLGKEIGR